MKRYHVLGVTLLAGFILGASIPAHAIDAKFRAKLEHSGCTQVTEANGTCDPNKTKAQNRKAQRPTTRLDKAASEAESVINTPISSAAERLLQLGWKPNNGQWYKNGHILRLVVEDDVIVNAQLVK
ncbi:hypothetical protein [Herbiconiux daphne]|uniref:PepSY domain-containing protein n=1 Tax=Herbiconiux daphne TaxID=2970914 RepID=A0ABT2H9V7_9MICO|nr:hypothetical protein [Herbiconiux daphne]MCS5736661.1 hypothetical protein [Herbiconiux daphne]